MKVKSKAPVIMDTNALIMQMEYRIDIEDELTGLLGAHEILIPSAVIAELHGINNKFSKAALKFASRFRTLDSVKSGDEAILSLALKLKAVVVTNDRELRMKLKENDLRVIYIRQRSYLAIDIP
ncbi:MAG: DNA-binding protein [Thermoplasmata archaeon]|nr:MAG: DNA-binding protein [Thermoplasmata archaeon]